MSDTVKGFDVPLRTLTDEEKGREITWRRFRDFHYEVGGDFLENSEEGSGLIFAGYLLAKSPQNSADILEIANNGFSGIHSYSDVLGFDEDNDIMSIYYYYANFCNLTTATKKIVNQTLILVMEHYGKVSK